MEWLYYLHDFSTGSAIIRIISAFVIGGIIGIEREKSGRAAGLRTHILVCVGSAMTMVIGLYASETLNLSSDPLRIAAQVVSGIGFLGVGTILVKGHDHITGLTTAAGLWATATVGIALGIGYYEAAIVCVAVMMLTTAILYRFEKKKTERRRGNNLYIELKDAALVNDFLLFLEDKHQFSAAHSVSPKSTYPGAVGIELNVTLPKDESYEDFIAEVKQNDNVLYVI